MGEVEISQKQARNLKMSPKIALSPGLQKCCLRASAKTSYQGAEEDIEEFMGIKVGHSSLHRLVGRTELPLAQSESVGVSGVSIDGGKICLRGEEKEGGQWRDYKLVSLHGDVCEAFFQDPEGLEEWSQAQHLSPIVSFVGDGHPGIWKVVESIAKQSWLIRREVLDWYHLKENLYKVGGSIKRLEAVEKLLWHGFIEGALRELEGLKNKKVESFKGYLSRHGQRIPDYQYYQNLGIPIGSGDVESRIKQVGARVQLPGCRWHRHNVSRILRLRCAYLNHSPLLSLNVLS